MITSLAKAEDEPRHCDYYDTQHGRHTVTVKRQTTRVASLGLPTSKATYRFNDNEQRRMKALT